MNVLLEQIRLGLESNDSVAPVLAMAIEHELPRQASHRKVSPNVDEKIDECGQPGQTVVQYRATPARPVLLSGSLAGSGGAILDGRRNGSDWRGLR